MKRIFAILFALLVISLSSWAVFFSSSSQQTVLLNVAYDVIRDYYKAYNLKFQANNPQFGNFLLSQSHGGASKQTLAVGSGLPADVVTLTQTADIDFLVEKGLVNANWQEALPNGAVPFSTVLVFLVRKGNPKQIQDWQDLTRDDVSVIFANPKTSANGRFAYLNALAFAEEQYQNLEVQQQFMQKLLANLPVLEAGARGATIAFTQRNLGDVLITPENEAALAAKALGSDFDVIYPSISAESPVFVAEVSKNTSRRNTHKLAQQYLADLWLPENQQLAADNYFRPSDEKTLKNNTALFPEVKTFDINERFGDWKKINAEHFVDNGRFDRLYIQAQQENK